MLSSVAFLYFFKYILFAYKTFHVRYGIKLQVFFSFSETIIKKVPLQNIGTRGGG